MAESSYKIGKPKSPDSKVPLTMEEQQKRAVFLLSLITGEIFAAGAIALIFGYSVQPVFRENLPIFLGLLAVCIAVGLTSLITASDTIIKNISVRATLLNLVTILALAVMALLVKGVAVQAGLIILLYTMAGAFTTLDKEQANKAINGGAIIALAVVVGGIFAPLRQVEIQGMSLAVSILLVMVVLIYFILVMRGSLGATLRLKLVSVVLAIVIIPLTILTTVQARFTRSTLQNQNTVALKFAADQTASRIDNFIADTLYNTTLNAMLPVFSKYIETPENERISSGVEASLVATIASIEKSQRLTYLDSIGILDITGRNIYDSSPDLQGLDESGERYFEVASKTGSPYFSPIHLPNPGEAYFVFSGPIRDQNQNHIGVLRFRYNATIFQRLAADNTGLFGEQSYPIIVDDQFIRIADAINPRFVYQPIVQLSPQTAKQLQSVQRLPPSYQPNPESYIPDIQTTLENVGRNQSFMTEIAGVDSRYAEMGVLVKMSNTPWFLLYVQGQGSLYEILDNQTRIASVLSTLIIGLVIFVAISMSGILIKPVTQLTETAQKIAAGNLDLLAPVKTNDELGTMASSFNAMTAQLRGLINELESRVQNRTQELSRQNEFLVFRARQLQTISDVARDVASAQELDTLLPSMTKLISERFDFYHVGIFLKDETGEYAVLRAANSEGGQRMLARQHKLRVGQVGIVGYVTGVGKPRIATDVGEDSVFFNNPDLPLTRSEMALPLKIGEQVIGALDVQSTASGAFSEADIELFGILADQIAIAISNNRLLEETNKALEEVSTLHRSYLRQEWKRQTEQKSGGFRYTAEGAVIKEKELLPEIRTVSETGQAIVQNSSVNEDGSLVPAKIALPILLRGEPIGVIHLEEQGKDSREWAENELLAVQDVADQIALALENARLFEDTVNRANRERKALEITSKMRSTNDFQTIIQVAVEELQEALNASRAQVVLRKSDHPNHDPEKNGREYAGNVHKSEPQS